MLVAIQFVLEVLINSVILYIITAKLLLLDETRFIKALIITLIGSLLSFIISYIIGDPTSFQGSLYSNIIKYVSSYLPMLILVKIAYCMNWEEFGYYFLVQIFFGGSIRFILFSEIAMFLNKIIG